MFDPFPRPSKVADWTRFADLVRNCFDGEGIRLIFAAAEMAKFHHASQIRADGSPYIVHPLRVATYSIMTSPVRSVAATVAALFHDALEDTAMKVKEVEDTFGPETSSITLELTRYRPAKETPRARAHGKEAKLKSILQGSWQAKNIKAWDLADNILSVRYIDPDRPNYRKIGRWIAEAEDLAVPFCKTASETACALIEREILYLYSQGFQRSSRVAF